MILDKCTCGVYGLKIRRGQPRGSSPPSRHQDKLYKMNRLQGPKPLIPERLFPVRNVLVPVSSGNLSTLYRYFQVPGKVTVEDVLSDI